MTKFTTRLKTASLVASAAAAMAAAAPAHAVQFNFVAALNGAAENPAVPSPATGTAYVTFDTVTSTISVTEIFVGLIGGPATGGHIHCCLPAPQNSSIAVPFPNFPAATSGIYTNTFSTFNAGYTFASLLAGAQAGQAYVNIHDSTYGGGEIRGFLVAVVPEPGTYALMFSGLAAVGLMTRRRKPQALQAA